MRRAKVFHYLVDGLTEEKAAVIRKGLNVVSAVSEVNVSLARSTVEVHALRDVQDQVKLACDVAGVHFRAKSRA